MRLLGGVHLLILPEEHDLNTILTAFAGDGRFPVRVDRLAREFSALRFPGEPVVDVKGGSLGRFEGALYPVHDGKGWAIIYNSDVSPGRQRFTIGHELGHYLMHRPLLPKGIDLWSKASARAFKKGLFFRTRGVPPVPVPAASMIARRDFADLAREGVAHPPGVWFNEGCNEITLHSDKYEQSVTILHFGKDSQRAAIEEEPPELDAFDRFSPKPRERLE